MLVMTWVELLFTHLDNKTKNKANGLRYSSHWTSEITPAVENMPNHVN